MKKVLVSTILLYKRFVSPVLEGVFGRACRFTPTCSEYTIEALNRFGVLKGLRLGVKRFLSCNHWGRSGYDPVPLK